MHFIEKLHRVLKAANEEWNKPESFAKGEDFESYLLEFTFPSKDYELLHRTSSFKDNSRFFATDTLLPDFKFRCRQTNKIFYVEAKFRNGTYWKNNKLEWTYPAQLQRYQLIDRNDAPVFLALGIGDQGHRPEYLFLIPMNEARFCGFYESFLSDFEFYVNKPVFPSYLWNL